MVQPQDTRSSRADTRSSDDAALIGLSAVAIALPFERLAPVVTLPWQRVTTVEFALAAGMMTWIASLVWTRERPRIVTPLLAPWAACIAVGFAASLAAPAHRADALKASARLASGLAIYALAINAVTDRRRFGVVVAALAAAGATVAAIVIAEFRGVGSVLGWLNEYRDGVRVVGGQVRAGGPLQYPTIAAMYLEVVFACAAGLWLSWWDARRSRAWRRARLVAGAVALVLIAEGVALTFTRAGLAGLMASLAVLAVWRWRARGFDGGVAMLAALGIVVVTLPLWSWSPEAVRLRFSSEGRQGWYRASFDAAPSLHLAAGEEALVPVTVTNTGRVTWATTADQPFRVSYHWLDGATDRVVQYDGARADLAADVAPGARADLDVPVRAPERPGRYRLSWDVVQEHRLWFGTEPGAVPAITDVTITPAAGPVRPLPPGKGPRIVRPAAVVLGRATLWRAAAQTIAAHPLFGIGPDNFRLTYGTFVGQAHADPRVHSNSMYLEVLTGAGLVGALAFGWLLWRAGRVTRATRGRLPARAASLYAGVAAAAVAVLVHGLVDSFLTFTPTGLAFALVLGLAAAPSRWPAAMDVA